jgi:hypothetical protein
MRHDHADVNEVLHYVTVGEGPRIPRFIGGDAVAATR